MSGLFGNITSALGWLFGNFWEDPTPPELTEPSEPPVPEEGSEEESEEGESEYETTLTYQNTKNTEIRWYSAIWRFYSGKSKVYISSSMMDQHNELALKMTSMIYPEIGFNQSQSKWDTSGSL